MFIGHFAVAFASKKVAPKVSLGTLVIAAAFPGPWSPPPPSENAVAIMGIVALAIFGPWAYWIDRHRVSAT